MEKSNVCLLKVAIVGGTLAFASPKQFFFWGGVTPSPYNRRPHGVQNSRFIRPTDLLQSLELSLNVNAIRVSGVRYR